MEKTKYTTRYVSRIVLEAKTPFAIGSGEKDLLTDALVAKDVNGLPYLPGTSLAGVIRSACDATMQDATVFGYQNNKEGHGSRVIFSDGVMIGKEGKPIDGLKVIDRNDDFYAHFITLPVRQHVRINSKGSTDKGGKFDEQVTYKGTRFCFEMELLSTGSAEDAEAYNTILEALCKDTFRVGSGTRNGFGLMKVISLQRRDYNLDNGDDLESYVSRSASLDKVLAGAKEMVIASQSDKRWQRYTLTLKPADFFLFGSGMGDEDADITPVSEAYIEWTDGKPTFKERGVLIPATSVKGALAHRTAYYWNKLNNRFADCDGDKPLTGDDVADVAVYAANAPEHVQIAEVLILATHQASGSVIVRK